MSDTDWERLEVVVPARAPRIPPGDYEAISVRGRRCERYGRLILELHFAVYAGEATASPLLAHLPYYLRWTRTPSPRSKLGRLLHLAGLESKRVSLSTLQHKLWRVRVVDAQHDGGGRPLTEQTAYSRVDEVLDRLT